MEEKKDYKRKGQTAPLTKRNNLSSRGNKATRTTRTNRKDSFMERIYNKKIKK